MWRNNLGGIPKPTPCFLDLMEKHRVIAGKQIWISPERNRLYTWDSLHGEIEVFDKNGYHLGSMDALTGKLIKPAVKGRRIHHD